jgi:hypothetical protein
MEREQIDPEFKAIWVAALRSGEYRQGRGALRNDPSDHPTEYCCLGVACDLAINFYGQGHWDGDIFFFDPEDHAGSAGLLPSSLARLMGFSHQNPRLGDETRTLTGLNDAGASFNYIADIIETEF